MQKNIILTQIGFAWATSKEEDVFSLTGTKRIKYLEENMAVINIKLEKRRDSAARQSL